MSLARLAQSYLDLKWHFDPSAGSAAGALDHDTQLGMYDQESVRAHVAACRALIAALEELDVADTQAEIDRTALLDELRVTVLRLTEEEPHRRNPAFWLGHLLNSLHTLILRDVGDPRLRARAAVARLAAAPRFLDAAEATINRPPEAFLRLARDMVPGGEVLIREVAQEHGRRRPELRGELLDAARAATAALREFGDALDGEIQPHPDAGAYAIGEELFDRRLHFEHAIRHGAPEIWRYGLHLADEVEAEVASIAAEIDPGRDWREVVEQVRAERIPGDPVERVTRELARGRTFVEQHDLVGIPDTPLQVTPTPGFLRPLIPFAAYAPPGALFPERTGYFYVSEPNGNGEANGKRPSVHDVAITAVHEGFPGHHLHFSVIAGLGSAVRRNVWSPLTIEGWALYSEELMTEHGFFRSAEERLLQRVHLLWRAVRILLDVGLHTRGMSIPDAEALLLGRMPMEAASAAAEVRRYTAWPTYQLCYAVGRRDLLALRDARRQRDGSGFSLRAFHDELLTYGGLPVELIRWGMMGG